MGTPIEGTRKLVTIADCAGNEVLIVGGALNVNAVIGAPAPGLTILNFTDVVVPPAAVGFALPAIPATAFRVTYQNVSPAAGNVRIRSAASVPPCGPQLAQGQGVTYGGIGGSIPVATPQVADGDPLAPMHVQITVEMP